MLAFDCNPGSPCTAPWRRRGTHDHNTIATRGAYFTPENNLLGNSNSALGVLGRSPVALTAQEYWAGEGAGDVRARVRMSYITRMMQEYRVPPLRM